MFAVFFFNLIFATMRMLKSDQNDVCLFLISSHWNNKTFGNKHTHTKARANAEKTVSSTLWSHSAYRCGGVGIANETLITFDTQCVNVCLSLSLHIRNGLAGVVYLVQGIHCMLERTLTRTYHCFYLVYPSMHQSLLQGYWEHLRVMRKLIQWRFPYLAFYCSKLFMFLGDKWYENWEEEKNRPHISTSVYITFNNRKKNARIFEYDNLVSN